MPEPRQHYDAIAYHGHCPDGLVSVWVALQYINLQYPPRLIPLSPNESALPHLQECGAHHTLMLDLSPKIAGELEQIAALGSLTVIDHHTSSAWLKDYPDVAVHDENHAACALTWGFFQPQRIHPALVQYVEDRDLWRFALPHSRAVNAYIQLYLRAYRFVNADDFSTQGQLELLDSACADTLMLDNPHDLTDPPILVKIGHVLLKSKAHAIDTIIAKSFISYFPGWAHEPYAAVLVGTYEYYEMRSDIGEALNNKYELPAAVFYRTLSGTYYVSLRSRHDSGIDVSKLAAAYGGGGHNHAAGFHTELDPISLVRKE